MAAIFHAGCTSNPGVGGIGAAAGAGDLAPKITPMRRAISPEAGRRSSAAAGKPTITSFIMLVTMQVTHP